MKNVLMIAFIVLIVLGMTFAILHVTGVFVIKDFVIAQLRKDPENAKWFKTHDEVVTMSAEMAELQETISKKDLEISKLQAQLNKLQNDLLIKDQGTDEVKKQMTEMEQELADWTIGLKDMSDIYSKMDPKKAATILQNMENDLIVQLLKKLKRDVAAEILSFFAPDRAAKITHLYTVWERDQ